MMKSHETSAQKPSAATGSRASIRAFLDIKGSAAVALRLPGMLVLAAVLVLALSGGLASAAVVHPYKSRLTEAGGFVPYPFTDPDGITVDNLGSIWVTDPGGSAVDKFDPAGSLEAQSDGGESFAGSVYIESAAWSNAAKLLLVSDSNHDDLWGLNADASYAKTDLNSGLGSGCCYIRVAADDSGGATSGDLYVFSSHGTVLRIDASGKAVPYTAGSSAGTNELTGADTPAESFGGPGERAGGGIAVNAAGRLFVADGAHHVVDVFDPSGAFVEAITEAGSGQPLGDVSAVAIDPTSGNLLVADQSNATIDEFSTAGVFVSRITEAQGAPLGVIQGLAVDSAGRVYASDGSNKVVDVFGPLAVLPDLTTGAVSNVAETDTSLTLNGTVNTAGSTSATALTDCHFQYVTQSAFEQAGFSDLGSGGEQPCVPSAASITNDGAVHAVSADLTGLTPNVLYRYRLIATNSNGTSYGNVETTPALIGITGEAVANVSATSAGLFAEINPHGLATAYRFEYLSEAAYQANGGSFTGPNAPTSLPVPDASVGAGEAAVSVSQHVADLSPATVYRYRVRAVNSLGPVQGPVRGFTTQTPGGFVLPDDRAWELVSPPDKHGADLNSLYDAQAAVTGDAVTYLANGPTEAEPPGDGGSSVDVLSVRNSAGWESRDLAAPHQAATSLGGEYRLSSQDLSRSAVEPVGLFNPAISAEASELTPYLRANFSPGDLADPCTGSCYRPLVTGAPGVSNVPAGTTFGEEALCAPPNQPDGCGPRFLGASPDLSHIVLASTAPLTPGAPQGIEAFTRAAEGDLYEWAAGHLTLVSVLPDGEPAVPASVLTLGGGGAVTARRSHAISADGTRVVWYEKAGISEPEGIKSHLYLRYNATQPQSAVSGSGECTNAVAACTLQLDQLKGGSGEGPIQPEFQTASSDDSKIFFTDEQRLTAHSGAEARKPDLYECEVVAAPDGELECNLTDITPELTPGEPAGVAGSVIGASEDGSSVYFAAGGVLTGAEENAEHERAQPGHCGENDPDASTCNLYRDYEGAVTFVTKLSKQDERDWGRGSVQGGFHDMTARVSPDGEWLAFMSSGALTGYDNHDSTSGLPDQEVYLYHASTGAGTGSLVCASCNPTGARPHGITAKPYRLVELEGEAGPWAASIPTWHGLEGNYQTRYLSNSGRLFFDSEDALVPQDTNGTEDVYEFESPGVGTCTTSSIAFAVASGGCVELISSGASKQESVFFDASESGDDVFFLTGSKLSSRDTDTSLDLYDARVGGGEAEAIASPACEGDSCQSAVPSPNDPTPGSLTFSGPGNVNPVVPAARAKKTAAQLRTEKLAAARRACRKDKSKKKRAKCEAAAQRKYGPANKSKKATNERGAKS